MVPPDAKLFESRALLGVRDLQETGAQEEQHQADANGGEAAEEALEVVGDASRGSQDEEAQHQGQADLHLTETP